MPRIYRQLETGGRRLTEDGARRLVESSSDLAPIGAGNLDANRPLRAQLWRASDRAQLCPTQSGADDFMRPDGPLAGPDWVVTDGAPQIVSHNLRLGGASAEGAAWVAMTSNSLQFARARFMGHVIPNPFFVNAQSGPVVFRSGAGIFATCYIATTGRDLNGADLVRLRAPAGDIATSTHTLIAGEVLEIRARQVSAALTKIQVLVNGALVIDYADTGAPLAGGIPGLAWAQNDGANSQLWTNFETGAPCAW